MSTLYHLPAHIYPLMLIVTGPLKSISPAQICIYYINVSTTLLWPRHASITEVDCCLFTHNGVTYSVEVIAANCYFVAHLAFDAHLILPTTAVAAIRFSIRASVLAFGATPLFKERSVDGSFWIRGCVGRRLRDRHSDRFEYQKGGEDKRKALEMHGEDFCGDKW